MTGYNTLITRLNSLRSSSGAIYDPVLIVGRLIGYLLFRGRSQSSSLGVVELVINVGGYRIGYYGQGTVSYDGGVSRLSFVGG